MRGQGSGVRGQAPAEQTDLLEADGLTEDGVAVLLLQLAQHGSQQDVEGRQLVLEHRLLLLHLTEDDRIRHHTKELPSAMIVGGV